MKKAEELTVIGQFSKPHGIHGELSAETDLDEKSLKELPCIFVDFDGLKVPFFISSIRPKGKETILISIDGIDNEKDALAFSRKEFYAEKEYIAEEDDDIVYLQDMKGYSVYDDGTLLGTVSDIDDSTANVLFVIDCPDGSSLLAPASEDMIEKIDTVEHVIVMNLPQGLVDL